jgi:hypothetical protein
MVAHIYILAIQEAEIMGLMSQSQPRQKVSETTPQSQKQAIYICNPSYWKA